MTKKEKKKIKKMIKKLIKKTLEKEGLIQKEQCSDMSDKVFQALECLAEQERGA